MTYRVLIEDNALRAFGEHLDYLAVKCQAPVEAGRWAEKAIRLVESLDRMPHRFPLAPEDAHRAYVIRFLRVDRCLFL